MVGLGISRLIEPYIKFMALVLLFMVICSTFVSISTLNVISESLSVLGGNVVNSREVGDSYRFIDIFIPVSRVRELVGVRVDRVFASLCEDDTVVASVKLIPRRFIRSHFATLNETLLIPDVGDGILSEEDMLVISLPIRASTALVIGNSSTSMIRDVVNLCPWSRYAAKYGVKDRVLMRFSSSTQVLGGRGFEKLGQNLAIAIYFSRNISSAPLFLDILYDIDVLDVLGNALSIAKPKPEKIDRRYEEQMNIWLRRIREGVRALEVEKNVDIVLEHREGFIYDFKSDKLVMEVKDRNELNIVKQQTEFFTSDNHLINGGGGPLRFYEFIMIIRNNSVVSSSHSITPIYLGFNVYSAYLYVRARSSSSSSYLAVDIRITDFNSGSIVWSYTYMYQLSLTPSNIFIFPSIPFDSSRAFNISITFRYIGGSYPYIDLASLAIHKIWDQMPTPQTVKGYQIVSVGIASIRSPWSTQPPPGCLRARASDILDPSVYSSGGLLKHGVMFYSFMESVSIDTVVMNGLYYDALTTSSPLLHVDICVFNPYTSSVSGSINVKLNGVTYLSQQLSIAPNLYGYVGSTIFMGINPVYGAGPIITIESTFPNEVVVYVDALIEYQYAPEVLRPDNNIGWGNLEQVPWLKLSVSQVGGSVMLWRSGITLGSRAVNARLYIPPTILAKHRISVAEAQKVYSGGIYFSKPLVADVACNLRYEGTDLEQYVGIAATVWGLISLGIDIAELVGVAIPNPVAGGMFIAGLAFTIVMSATGQSEKVVADSYMGCRWRTGVFQDFKWVEIEAYVTPTSDLYIANPQLNVRFEANDIWYSKYITMKVFSYNPGQSTYYYEQPMFFGRRDIHYG